MSASPARLEHRPAATSQRSLQACTSSPIAVLLDGKVILRVGPLHWGWTTLLEVHRYGPDSMRVIIQAFDDAWQEIAGNYGADISDERRNRLALLILAAAEGGE